MMKFLSLLVALRAAAEADNDEVQLQAEAVNVEEVPAVPESYLKLGHDHHGGNPQPAPVPPPDVIPPYPSVPQYLPKYHNHKSSGVEVIQITASKPPLDAIIRQKTKTKAGPSIPFERSALECSCPDTYQLFGDRCERIIETPQETMCPQGFELLNNRCVRTIRPEERCPFGYATINNRCIRRDVAVPKMACSDGYTLEASAGLTKHDPTLVCVRQNPVDNVLECPDGARYNGQCFSHENVPAEFTCPLGYDPLGNGTCRRIATVPCGVEKHEKGYKTLAVPPKRKLAEEEGVVMTRITVPHDAPMKSVPVPGALRGKSETANYHKWHQTHVKDHPVNVEIIDVEQTCVANITIPANPYCPVGELHGRLCRVAVPTQPVEICPAYGTPNNCFAFDRQNPFATCPDGYNQECAIMKHTHIDSYVDCECVSIHECSIELFCPAGYAMENGLCVLRADAYTGCSGMARPVNGVCQRTDTSPAVCSYTVSYACEGPACSTSVQHPHQEKKDKPVLHKF